MERLYRQEKGWVETSECSVMRFYLHLETPPFFIWSKPTANWPSQGVPPGDRSAPAADRGVCACNFCEFSSLALFVTQLGSSVSCTFSLHRERHKASAEILRMTKAQCSTSLGVSSTGNMLAKTSIRGYASGLINIYVLAHGTSSYLRPEKLSTDSTLKSAA